MSKKFSHSKLSTFEQCRLKYKFKYIDKIVPEIEQTIEALLGSMVHETLEWLYIQVKQKQIPTLDETLLYYIENWEKNYKPAILIVKQELTAEDYFNKGVQFLLNYYKRHHPFDDNTLETEMRIKIPLDELEEYEIMGFIDRLAHNIEDDEYEIHDYKTSNNLPTQKSIENDRQLALYSLAIKEMFGYEKKVCLVWHYLNFDQRICSRRTNEQLEQLKKEILKLIKEIEATTEFPHNKSVLCRWCEYKNMCPAWNPQRKI